MSESDPIRLRRPWLAAVLAVVVPGLGHVYARAWQRALLWFALFLTALWVLVPDELQRSVLSFETFSEIYGTAPDIGLFLLAILVMNVIDAYLTTTRKNYQSRQQVADATQRCPHCGKELDDDLTFCHWCTTEVDSRK